MLGGKNSNICSLKVCYLENINPEHLERSCSALCQTEANYRMIWLGHVSNAPRQPVGKCFFQKNGHMYNFCAHITPQGILRNLPYYKCTVYIWFIGNSRFSGQFAADMSTKIESRTATISFIFVEKGRLTRCGDFSPNFGHFGKNGDIFWLHTFIIFWPFKTFLG